MTQAESDRPSTPGLIGDVVKQTTALFSAEVSLIRLEITEKLVTALAAVVGIVVAAVFMIVALIFLLQGLVELLVQGLGWPMFAASFAVGGGILVIAVIAAIVAARSLSAARLKPARVLREVEGTTDLVKGVVS